MKKEGEVKEISPMAFAACEKEGGKSFSSTFGRNLPTFPISAQIDFPSHKIREAPADAGIPPALKKTWRFPFFFLSFL